MTPRAARFPAAALAGILACSGAAAVTPVARQYAEAEQVFQSGDLNRAQALFTAIIENHGDEPLAWFRLGLIHQRQQSFRTALNAYDTAISLAVGDSSPAYQEVLAKARFNRALLLLESAAVDLRSVPAGVLSPGRDVILEALTQHVDAALVAAGSDDADPPKSAAAPGHRTGAALGYVYEAKAPPAPSLPEVKSP